MCFFFQAEDGIRDGTVTGVQTCALPISELGGVHVKKGQRVVLFYRSANFDEEVFDDPFTFDIMRSPNPHVGLDRKSTRLNSSHSSISYAVFCLKKKKKKKIQQAIDNKIK